MNSEAIQYIYLRHSNDNSICKVLIFLTSIHILSKYHGQHINPDYLEGADHKNKIILACLNFKTMYP